MKNIINSIQYVLLSLLLALPIGIAIGSLLNRKIKGIAILRTLIVIPWILSQTVTALLWGWLLNGNYGLITYWVYLLTGQKIDLFSSAILAKILVVIVNVWNTVPVIIILTIAALQTISPDLIEAAKVDGASRRTIYFKITLPMIKPTMATGSCNAKYRVFQHGNIDLCTDCRRALQRDTNIESGCIPEWIRLLAYGYCSGV